jgi:hypothetical protein
MERLLRFESVIAICALLISAITGAAIVYQTQIIRSQYAATIWPYLSVDTNIIDPRHLEVIVTNDGLGPALMRSAQLFVDGRHVLSWENFTSVISAEVPHGSATFSSSTINASTTIRPGDTHHLIGVKLRSNVSPAVLKKHRIALRFCYCSLNDACWSLHAVAGVVTGEYPQRVASCAIDKGIAVKLL